MKWNSRKIKCSTISGGPHARSHQYFVVAAAWCPNWVDNLGDGIAKNEHATDCNLRSAQNNEPEQQIIRPETYTHH